MTWPFPGDGPAAKRGRVAQAYRAALAMAAPEVCAEMDDRMRALGQMWVVPEVVAIDPERWLSVPQAAELACVEPDTLRQWRRRKRLTGRLVAGHWQYQTKEILAVFCDVRGRSPGVTDTLSTSGTAVPEA